MSKNNGGKVKFSIDKTGFFAESAIFLLIMAMAFRFIGCWGMWTDRVNAIMMILLPICCCLLMILCILLFGKKGFFLSFIPVLLGVVFFVFKSLQFDSWIHTVLCILLYMVIAVAYTGTVFGWIPTKWLLPPLFGLPFLYHVYTDVMALSAGPESVSFLEGMREISILCIMAAMFCVGMGLKKRTPAPTEIEPEVVEPAPVPETQPIPAPEAQPAPAQEPVPEEKETAPIPKPEITEPVLPEESVPDPEKDAAENAFREEDFLNEEPYHATLTLDPEPWEPEGPAQEKPDASENGQE